MFEDAHAHLNENFLSNFVELLSKSNLGLRILSNSVDIESSRRNIDLSKRSKNIIPFVGIHPEIFSRSGESRNTKFPDSIIESLKALVSQSGGIGEIGLDPKYGSDGEQEILFKRLLEICEESKLPVSIHNRESVSRILDILSTFNLKNEILFHWFAGSDQELTQIEDRRFFLSFGPSLLFSKRLARIFEKSNPDLVLSETDAPTPFASINEGRSTSILIPSVVFKMGLIKNISFKSMKEQIEHNTNRYLERKTH